MRNPPESSCAGPGRARAKAEATGDSRGLRPADAHEIDWLDRACFNAAPRVFRLLTAQTPEMHALLQVAAHRLDPLQLVLNASLVVKLVILVLVAMSVACWFIIGTKALRLLQAQRQSARFLDLFWSKEEGNRWATPRLESIYAQISAHQGSPLARVFHAGYVELARVSEGGTADAENVERALRRASSNEMTRLEDQLPFLATTGSVGPFIGLFGTVWGIMDSFLSIAAERGATLDVVAPGIAEALIATAIGLLAAIPAVMAYNYFIRRIRVIEAETEAFAMDYLNIVRRHFL